MDEIDAKNNIEKLSKNNNEKKIVTSAIFDSSSGNNPSAATECSVTSKNIENFTITPNHKGDGGDDKNKVNLSAFVDTAKSGNNMMMMASTGGYIGLGRRRQNERNIIMGFSDGDGITAATAAPPSFAPSTTSGGASSAIVGNKFGHGGNNYGDGDGGVVVVDDNNKHENDFDEKEKTDATPENLKKIDDVISSGNYVNESSSSNNTSNNNSSNEQQQQETGEEVQQLKIIEDESSSSAKQNLAFTIDFGNSDSTVTAAVKYKNIMERFQNRHRRGASLSKLEDQQNISSTNNVNVNNSIMLTSSKSSAAKGGIIATTTTTTAAGATISSPSSSSASIIQGRQPRSECLEADKVKLRIRQRSTSGVRDSNKRHSWSPRSSTHEILEMPNKQQLCSSNSKQQQQKQQQSSSGSISSSSVINNNNSNNNNNIKNNVNKISPVICKKTSAEIESSSDNNIIKGIQTKSVVPTTMMVHHKKYGSGGGGGGGGGGVGMPMQYFKDEQSNSNNFTPRSTAMQIALNKFEFICPEPPLELKNFTNSGGGGGNDTDNVSEAGTYTLDGDNYTEEQKELMNIDKTANYELQSDDDDDGDDDDNNTEHNLNDLTSIRPSDLPLMCTLSSSENRRRNNVLEVNYYHDSSTNIKPKISYLEKIKSRVKNITKSPDKKLNNLPKAGDIGMFTSVTTSGILSKKPTLDANPRLGRRNSLTKSQVDSSEYISAAAATVVAAAAAAAAANNSNNRITPTSNTYTDYQKAEYKLNLFSNQDEYIVESSPDTLDSSNNSYPKLKKIETGLKSAQSKNDWIQEWARNARARSITTTNDFGTSHQISQNYHNNCETIDGDFTNDSCSHHSSSNNEKINLHRMRDIEYSSDTNISLIRNKIGNNNNNNSNNGVLVNCRPPLSPSRIPSPMHSMGRIRNCNRQQRDGGGGNQDVCPPLTSGSPGGNGVPETDIYLQKTAAAISNLTQSLSRKNSLQSCKSLSSTNESPRRMFHNHHYSADEYSPPHHKNRNDLLHKRNLSLDYQTNVMSQSLNNDILNGYLDYRNRHQQRPRQNSIDGGAIGSPNRNSNNCRQAFIDQTQLIKQHGLPQSPLRRSNSFSVKAMSKSTTHKNPTIINKNANNIQRSAVAMPKGGGATNSTPASSAAAAVAVIKNPIQKSASSTSFRKMYSDYDDNIAYYINDEDDLIDDYCSSEEIEDNERYIVEQEMEGADPPEPPELLTTTRYNKALLMRIERSKQKVAGMAQMKPQSAGVMACPNTPEMPRRAVHSAARSSMRQSVPRDSSLNRLRGEIPSSLASAKKQLLQTAASGVGINKKIQPKYMDISKYKSPQAASFLKKDESKSTLLAGKSEVKRSPSSASVGLNRADPVRASNRSVKSAGAGGNSKSSSSARRDASVSKQKEVELAMWKRRATYDPLKAAAEGRRKQEEAKKMIAQSQSKSGNNCIVLRSQSFHSGVDNTKPTTTTTTKTNNRIFLRNRGDYTGERRNNALLDDGGDSGQQWTPLTSTESSDEDDNEYFVGRKS